MNDLPPPLPPPPHIGMSHRTSGDVRQTSGDVAQPIESKSRTTETELPVAARTVHHFADPVPEIFDQ